MPCVGRTHDLFKLARRSTPKAISHQNTAIVLSPDRSLLLLCASAIRFQTQLRSRVINLLTNPHLWRGQKYQTETSARDVRTISRRLFHVLAR